jgi:hypothetical protein
VMMVVEVVVSGSGSSVMLITFKAARVVALVRGTTKDIGCGFKIFTGEIHVQGFLIEGSPMKAMARFSFTSFPNSKAWYGIYGNIGNFLFLLSKGSTSPSSSEFVAIWTFDPDGYRWPPTFSNWLKTVFLTILAIYYF